MPDNPAMPTVLAGELHRSMNFELLDKLCAHRTAYLLQQLDSPKPYEEVERIWGQLEELKWLKKLSKLVESIVTT